MGEAQPGALPDLSLGPGRPSRGSEPPRPGLDGARGSEASAQLQLLLVEDSPSDSFFVCELLAEWARMEVLPRVADALEVLSTRLVDAVLLDMGLPDARGVEGLEAIRAAHPTTPIIVLTGSDEDLSRKVLASGAQDYLPKSELSEDTLLRAVMHGLLRQQRVAKIDARRRDAERRVRGLRTVLDAVPDAIALYDADGRIVFANERARAWLIPEGVQTVDGLALGDFVDLEAARSAPSELRLRLDGQDRYLRVAVVATQWEERALDCLLVRDETEERRTRAAGMAIRESERLVGLGQLAASVAHEINNPLAAISANLEALHGRSTPRDGAAERSMLEDALSASQRVAVIVRDLLTFARADGGAVSDVRLERVLDACLNLTASQLRRAGVEVVRRYRDVPGVRAIEGRLLQVAANLINNALDALRGGVGGRITLETGTWAGGVFLAVEDDGPGMPPDVLASACAPFFTTKAGDGGTGLGLAVSADIAQAHGGSLVLRSRPGRGARVELRLPFETGLVVEDARPSDVTAPKADPASHEVVIVDDDDMVRRGYERLLGAACRVSAFASAAEALEALATNGDVDLVVCDVEMPGIDGPMFLEALRARCPDLVSRLVFYTGGLLDPRREAAIADAGVPLLPKPVPRDTLLDFAFRSRRRRGGPP